MVVARLAATRSREEVLFSVPRGSDACVKDKTGFANKRKFMEKSNQRITELFVIDDHRRLLGFIYRDIVCKGYYN